VYDLGLALPQGARPSLYSVVATELPATGVAVIWRSTNLLAKGEYWSAVHAFPSEKQTKSDLPVRPSKTDSAFFKLS